MSNSLATKLTFYRDLLLNFSKRNKELYYRSSKNALLLRRLKLKSEGIDKFFEEGENLKKLLSDEQLNKTDWHKKAKKLKSEDENFQKEYGISGGWLLGPFLVWRIKDEPDILVSPIFKVPVNLEKNRDSFQLVTEDDNLIINPSLELLLTKKLGCELKSKLENGFTASLELFISELKKSGRNVTVDESVTDILRIPPKTKSVEDADGNTKRVPLDPKEYLTESEYHLFQKATDVEFFIQPHFMVDTLDSSKLTLYEDYNDILKNPQNPLIKSLLEPGEIQGLRWQCVEDVDKEAEDTNRFVVDIDSTQHLAIRNAAYLQGVVINGPPGTGKSQTITNLISQLLSEGKKVLFIAEKRVALDVVNARLIRANLEKEVVVLHTGAGDRQTLYKSFVNSAASQPNEKTIEKWNEVSKRLDQYKTNVKDYKRLISKEIESLRMSFEELAGFESAREYARGTKKEYSQLVEIDKASLEKLAHHLEDLQTLFQNNPNLLTSPWKGRKSGLSNTSKTKDALDDDSKRAINLFQKIEKLSSELNILKGSSFWYRIISIFKMKTLENEVASSKLALGKIVNKWIHLGAEPRISSESIESWFEKLVASFDDLRSIIKFQEICENIDREVKITSFGRFLSESLRLSSCWLTELEGRWADAWIQELLDRHTELQQFESKEFEMKVRRLTDQYLLHQTAAKEVVPNLIIGNRKTEDIKSVAIQALAKEAEKKRRVKSPRELMNDGALSTMLELKRCWLMSPLSVAQSLPNIEGMFDVVIFDEASQIRIEDAIPAVNRAKSLIVVGDSKQMPPTNFFGGSSEDDDDEENDIEPPESLLEQASRGFESITLRSHYRSQDESLIAFSNYAFYGSNLVAAPSFNVFGAGDAISFTRIENAYFSSKKGNITEAKAVVAKVAQILKENPHASVGVISMGVSQQKAIESELDLLAESDKDFDRAYTESLAYQVEGAFAGFFNKNLENVQGDERDTIIMSVGYAPAKPNAALRRAFGPLSFKGGGRRLNVAASRARRKLHLFCSFDPFSLEVDQAAYERNPETTTFVRFLHYVALVSGKSTEEARQLLKTFESAETMSSSENRKGLAKNIADRLTELGYPADVNVGDCGFKIDLAVRDQENSNRYLLAIEIDGGAHISAGYSRDRDRARTVLLRAKGWSVYNVWTQDWLRDRNRVISAIQEEIKSVIGQRVAS